MWEREERRSGAVPFRGCGGWFWNTGGAALRLGQEEFIAGNRKQAGCVDADAGRRLV